MENGTTADECILSQELQSFARLYVSGVDDARLLSQFNISRSTLRRWVRPSHPVGKLIEELKSEYRMMLQAVRDVLSSPQATPSLRLSAAMLLGQLRDAPHTGGDIFSLLSGKELQQIMRQRLNRERPGLATRVVHETLNQLNQGEEFDATENEE